MRTDIDTLPNGSARLTWRYQEARNEHLEFEQEHVAHISRLLSEKVASKCDPRVSLPRVKFVDEFYSPQTEDNFKPKVYVGWAGNSGYGKRLKHTRDADTQSSDTTTVEAGILGAGVTGVERYTRKSEDNA